VRTYTSSSIIRNPARLLQVTINHLSGGFREAIVKDGKRPGTETNAGTMFCSVGQVGALDPSTVTAIHSDGDARAAVGYAGG
jgi:hypothetical protein